MGLSSLHQAKEGGVNNQQGGVVNGTYRVTVDGRSEMMLACGMDDCAARVAAGAVQVRQGETVLIEGPGGFRNSYRREGAALATVPREAAPIIRVLA